MSTRQESDLEVFQPQKILGIKYACRQPSCIADRGKAVEQIRADCTSTIPPGHRMTKPEEIASVAAFLASNDANYMTGAMLNGTGGVHTRCACV